MADDNNKEQQNQHQNEGNNTPPAFDYDKLAEIISGKQSESENTILKNYFKNQGLSKEEAEQAIAAFKDQKAKNTPDASKLQGDLTAAVNGRRAAEIDLAATKAAIKQGVPVDSVEYLLRMGDFSAVVGEDGKISAAAVTEAVKKVLEAVPALKGASKAGDKKGFEKIGGDNNGDGDSGAAEDELRKAFGLKPKK